MPRKHTTASTRLFTPRASLAALGTKLTAIGLFDPVAQHVVITQKTVKHTPVEKLYDAFICLLAGAHGLVEINTLLRSDPALQRAFGRERAAEQSVVQDTLDACTPDNVAQMRLAFESILARHSLAYRHAYARQLQLLDVDLTALLCGPTAEGAKRGYFSNLKDSERGHARGRQLGRVVATHYDEVVADLLYPGNLQLRDVLTELVTRAESALSLSAERRARTIVRMDSGGGTMSGINFLLARGYQVHCRDYSGKRARSVVEGVREWFQDPKLDTREFGWVEFEDENYVRPVRRLACRWRRKNGQWAYGVTISTLSVEQAYELAGGRAAGVGRRQAEVLAYAYAYDKRGGGVECEFRESKQGLALTKRNKKRFAAQEMIVLLAALAQNVVVWARRWLAVHEQRVAVYGTKRFVRDLLRISGTVALSDDTKVATITLNAAAALTNLLVGAFAALLAAEHVSVNSG